MDINEISKFLSSGGRGKKQCMCGYYLGVRTAECPECGFQFSEKKYKKPKPTKHKKWKKGYKQCSKCAVYVGVRTKICPFCGFCFNSIKRNDNIQDQTQDCMEKEVRDQTQDQFCDYTQDPIKILQNPIKIIVKTDTGVEIHEVEKEEFENRVGKKYCFNCRTWVGVRTRTCKCGKKLVGKYEPPTELKQEDEDRLRYEAKHNGAGSLHIEIPSGPCPIFLKGTTNELIKEWVESIIAEGLKNKKLYLPSAIKYFLREFVDINGKHYKPICKKIDGIIEGNIDE